MSEPSVASTAAAPVVPATLFRSAFARRVIRVTARLGNPAMSLAAGTRWFPPFGLLFHRGRRSGRRYVTPVGMGWAGGGFVIPLTFGDHSHWYLNVLGAPETRVRWRGVERSVGHPSVISVTEAKPAFPAPLWLLLQALGIRRYLRLEPIA